MKRGMWDASLAKWCMRYPKLREYMRYLSAKRDMWEISLSRERCMRSLSIKGDVWGIFLLNRDIQYLFIIKRDMRDPSRLREVLVCEIPL